MSRSRFLSDHDLNEHIVTGVMRLEPSLEWIRVRDAGLSERSDVEILAYAAEHGYLVVSHDVNTMPKAAYDRMRSGHTMSGLLMVKQRDPIGPVIASILLIWSANETEEWENQVGFLPFD